MALCSLNRNFVAMKTKVLFICLGNICRSPAADGVMHHLVEQQGLSDLFEIDSAGIGNWHVGDLPDRRMRQCGQLRGYRFDHRARQIHTDDFAQFDYIIGMDHENMTALQHLKSQAANRGEDRATLLCLADFLSAKYKGQATVPDPYYGSQKDFEFALDLIEDACAGLLEHLSAR